MSKSTYKGTPRKPIMPQLLPWLRESTSWLKSRIPQALSQSVGCLGMFTLIVFITVIVFYYLVLPHVLPSFPETAESLEWSMQIAMLIVFGILLFWWFVLILISAWHPETRKRIDKLFGFVDKTKLEELEAKVGSIDKELNEIRSELRDIKTTLKTSNSKENNEEGKG